MEAMSIVEQFYKFPWADKIEQAFEMATKNLRILDYIMNNTSEVKEYLHKQIEHQNVIAIVQNSNGTVIKQITVEQLLSSIISSQFKSYRNDMKKMQTDLYNQRFGNEYELLILGLTLRGGVFTGNLSLLENAFDTIIEREQDIQKELRTMKFEFKFYIDEIKNLQKYFDDDIIKKDIQSIGTNGKQINDFEKAIEIEFPKFKKSLEELQTVPAEMYDLLKEFNQMMNSIFTLRPSSYPIYDILKLDKKLNKLLNTFLEHLRSQNSTNGNYLIKILSNINLLFDKARHAKSKLDVIEKQLNGQFVNFDARNLLGLKPFTRLCFDNETHDGSSFPSAQALTHLEVHRIELVKVIDASHSKLIKFAFCAKDLLARLMAMNIDRDIGTMRGNEKLETKVSNMLLKFDQIEMKFDKIIANGGGKLLGDKLKQLHDKTDETIISLEHKLIDLIANAFRSGHIQISQKLWNHHKATLDSDSTRQFIQNAIDVTFRPASPVTPRANPMAVNPLAQPALTANTIAEPRKMLESKKIFEIIDKKIEKCPEQHEWYKYLTTVKQLLKENYNLHESLIEFINVIEKFSRIKISSDKFYPDQMSYELVDTKRTSLISALNDLLDKIEIFIHGLEEMAKNHFLGGDRNFANLELLVKNQKRVDEELKRGDLDKFKGAFLVICHHVTAIQSKPFDANIFDNANKNLSGNFNQIVDSYSSLINFIDVVSNIMYDSFRKSEFYTEDIY